MPALLGPANPVPGYDNPPVKITTPTPNDTSVQNILNPQQVVRPDGRTDLQNAGDAAQSFAARYESNFMTFLQRLRNVRDLRAALLQVLQGGGKSVTSGITAGFAEELSQFLEFMKMDESQLLPFLKNQVESGSRFTGALFQVLRGAYDGTQSELLKNDIVQFLRRFSDYSSTNHLAGKMLRTMSDMSQSLPSRWADQLISLTAKLQNGFAAGDRAGNLKLLREQVFPLISQYVSLTHDHGRARTLLSMLTLDVARYENGSPEGLLQSLRNLVSNGVLPDEFRSLPDQELLRLLQETDFFKAAGSNAFADKLAAMTGKALRGEGGVSNQDAFRNILSSLLLNESVYMPLNHVMLPLQWNDRMVFSELWVDPDSERESPQRPASGPKTISMLLKMDVQGLGAFDLYLNVKELEVNLQVSCPKAVADYSPQVSQAMTTILQRNGLRPNTVKVEELKRPMTISEAFPKIFGKASGVNVKI